MKHEWHLNEQMFKTALASMDPTKYLGRLYCKTGDKSFAVEIHKEFRSKTKSNYALYIYEECEQGRDKPIGSDRSIHFSSTLTGLQNRVEHIADRIIEDYLYDGSKEDVIDALEDGLAEYLHGLVICDNITRREMSSVLWNFRRWAKTAEYGEEYTYDGNTYALMIPRSDDGEEEEIA